MLKNLRLTAPRTAYIVGLVLIVVLGTVQLAGTRLLSDRQKVAAMEINISGRQRMLSQRIALSVERLTRAPDDLPALEREKLRQTVLACTSLMERSHAALIARDAEQMRNLVDAGAGCFMQGAGDTSLAQKGSELSSSTLLAEFTRNARQVAESQQSISQQDLSFIGDEKLQALLLRLDAETYTAQEDTIRQVQIFLTVNWFLLVALVLGEAFFLFQPMARTVDVTIKRLKKANVRLSESERRLKDFASTAADHFWETDEKHTLTWLGSAGLEMPVRGAFGALGHKRYDPDLLGDGGELVDWEAHQSVLAAHKAFENFEQPMRTNTGEVLWWRVSGKPVFDDSIGFCGYRGTASDITEEKRNRARTRQTERMLALGQLTAGVAHDFNNLLSVIQGNAELLELETNSRARSNNVSEIVTAVERGASLTSRLLAFGLRQALNAEPVELNAFFRSTYDLLDRTLGEDFSIRIQFQQRPLYVHVDRHQLEDAVLNLALNARDACAAGGVLEISSKVQSRVVHMPLSGKDFGAGELVCLRFQDNGCGIDEADVARVFEPFYTTKPVGEGSGLGLSMVYGFALQSGGFLEISSLSNKGTTVDLFLPRAEASMMRKKVNDYAGPASFLGKRVLLLEDNAPFRRVAVKMLESLDMKVTEAADGETALSLLSGEQPFDLLIADVVLPGRLNGVQTAEEARIIRPSLAIVFSSGFVGGQRLNAEMVLPPDDLLRKPFRREQLIAAIHTAFAQAAERHRSVP